MNVLTVKEVAERLKVSQACIYQLVAEGLLPAVRIGIGRGVIRFTEEDLQTFMTDSRTCPPKPKSPSYRPTHLTLQKRG